MNTKTTDTQHDPFDMFAEALMNLVWWCCIGVGVSVWWAILFPMISIPLIVAVAVGGLAGWPVGVVLVGISIAGMVLWRAKHPETFERWVSRRARVRFLIWWRYRRRWSKFVTACGLSVTYDDGTLVPRLAAVDIGDYQDRLQVRMLAGQCPADYENRTIKLAHAFGVEHCYASIVGPGTVGLIFRHHDAHTDTDSRTNTIEVPRIDGGLRRKDAA
ncbi:hypothetical protein [Nocardia sp. NPDC004604]|uniref:hypothetical protein n=1 Tax=Nocardia sp. NPDC004604 TaxID=3157013 RepID=UPI0033A6A933